MIPLSLATEELELRVWLAVDAPAVAWLGRALLAEPSPGAAVVDDILREMVNTAGGAIKRAALPESVTLTAGIPTNDAPLRTQGDGIRSYTFALDGGKASMALMGEIRKRDNTRVPASKLREGMVLVHDLRSENGMLLVAAGSRLTSTTAERVAKLLGDRFFVEVASAA
jgi:hypothetical protein